MRRLVLVAWLCALGLFAGAASAQALRHVAFGQRLSATASAEGGEFYAFVGVQGTRVQVQLGLPGALGAVTLYDANGDELARQEGEGFVSLAHALPDDGIYLLGVTSAVKGKDYALALDGQEPEVAPAAEAPVAGIGATQVPAPVAAPAPEAAPAIPPTSTASAAPALATATAPAPTAIAADPAVWGIYARLAGRQSVSVPGRYALAWVWTTPGEVLVEEWRDATGRIAHTNTITPTGQPGQLRQRASYLGGKEWLGRVGEDGRVTYVGRGLLKWPFLVEISPEGMFQMRRTKVDGDGNPVSIDPPTELTRWELAPAAGHANEGTP